METTEIRKMNESDLAGKVSELRTKVRDLKMQKFVGGEMNTALIGTSRRELARVLTIMSEMKRAPEAKSNAKPVAKSSSKPRAKKGARS